MIAVEERQQAEGERCPTLAFPTSHLESHTRSAPVCHCHQATEGGLRLRLRPVCSQAEAEGCDQAAARGEGKGGSRGPRSRRGSRGGGYAHGRGAEAGEAAGPERAAEGAREAAGPPGWLGWVLTPHTLLLIAW